MKNEVDVLFINSKKDFKQSLINDFLDRKWKKENDDKYNGYGFHVEFFNKGNMIILKIYVIDQWNIIHSSKKRFYGFFLSIGLQKIIDRIKKIIQGIDQNVTIEHKYFHSSKSNQILN